MDNRIRISIEWLNGQNLVTDSVSTTNCNEGQSDSDRVVEILFRLAGKMPSLKEFRELMQKKLDEIESVA